MSAYIKTLNRITNDDEPIVGGLAVNLAAAKEKGYETPLGFVITTESHEEYKKKRTIPEKLQEELIEAYNSLSITGEDAESLVESLKEPKVTIIPSKPGSNEINIKEYQQNVFGEDAFIKTIKKIWDEKEEATAILVQEQEPRTATIITTYNTESDAEIKAKAYQGLIDEEATGGYEYLIKADHLLIIKKEHQPQPFKKISDKEPLKLKKTTTKTNEAMINDKIIREAARITKRLHLHFNEEITAFFAAKKEKIILLLIERKKPLKELKEYLEEEEEEKIILEENTQEITNENNEENKEYENEKIIIYEEDEEKKEKEDDEHKETTETNEEKNNDKYDDYEEDDFIITVIEEKEDQKEEEPEKEKKGKRPEEYVKEAIDELKKHYSCEEEELISRLTSDIISLEQLNHLLTFKEEPDEKTIGIAWIIKNKLRKHEV